MYNITLPRAGDLHSFGPLARHDACDEILRSDVDCTWTTSDAFALDYRFFFLISFVFPETKLPLISKMLRNEVHVEIAFKKNNTNLLKILVIKYLLLPPHIWDDVEQMRYEV